MRRTRVVLAATLLSAASVVLAACGSSSPNTAATPPADATTTTSTTTGPAVTTPAALQDYVGLTVAEAEARAKTEDRVTRVVQEDGEQFPATADFVPTRLNFVVENGKVTSVSTG